MSQLWVWLSPILSEPYRAQSHFCLKLAHIESKHTHHAHEHQLSQCMLCVLQHSHAAPDFPPSIGMHWVASIYLLEARLDPIWQDILLPAFQWPFPQAPPSMLVFQTILHLILRI